MLCGSGLRKSKVGLFGLPALAKRISTPSKVMRSGFITKRTGVSIIFAAPFVRRRRILKNSGVIIIKLAAFMRPIIPIGSFSIKFSLLSVCGVFRIYFVSMGTLGASQF
jgi:hypothetical protein